MEKRYVRSSRLYLQGEAYYLAFPYRARSLMTLQTFLPLIIRRKLPTYYHVIQLLMVALILVEVGRRLIGVDEEDMNGMIDQVFDFDISVQEGLVVMKVLENYPRFVIR